MQAAEESRAEEASRVEVGMGKLTDRLKLLTAELQQARLAADEAETRALALEQSLAPAQAELQTSKATLESERQQTKVELETLRATLESERQQTKVEQEALRATLESERQLRQKSHNDLKLALEGHSKQVTALQGMARDNIETSCLEANQRADVAETEAQAARDRSNELCDELIESRSAHDGVSERLLEVRNELAHASSEAEKRGRLMDKQVDEFRTECAQLRGAASLRDDRFNAVQSLLEQRAEEFQDQLTAAQLEKDVVLNGSAELAEELRAASGECEDLSMALAEQARDHEAAFTALTDCRASLESEALDLKEAVSVAEANAQTVAEESARRLAASEASAASSAEEAHQRTREALESENRFAERASAADERATEARVEVEELRREQGEREAARTNLESHKQMIKTLQQRLAELESQSQGERSEADRRYSELHRKYEELQQRLGRSRGDELATIIESRTGGESLQSGNPEIAAQSSSDGDHIAELERRCQILQRKLNTRPIVYQATAEDLESPTSSASSTSLTSVFKEMVEAPLRSFTRRLLKRDAWLFVFYIHLLFLYMVVASFLGSTSLAGNGSIDCVNLRMTQWEPTAMAQPLAAITTTLGPVVP